MTRWERKEITRASIWMTLISLALCLVPVLNGLVAGMVGGLRVSSLRHAMLAAVIAGVVSGLVSFLLLSMTLPRLIGASSLGAVVAWVLVSEAGLLAGAAIGEISRPAHAAA
jgi:hypothetical protein